MLSRLGFLACSAFTFAALSTLPAVAQEACMKQGHQAASTYQDNDPALAGAVRQAQRLQQAGLDPNHYIVEEDGKFTLLSVKLHDLAEKSAATLESSGTCSEKMMPFRKMADVKMIYEHYGLTAMLPPAMEKTNYLGVVGGAPMPEGGMMPAETIFGVMQLTLSPEMEKIMRKPYCVFGACS